MQKATLRKFQSDRPARIATQIVAGGVSKIQRKVASYFPFFAEFHGIIPIHSQICGFFLSSRLTVGQRTLDPFILVRIQASQLNISKYTMVYFKYGRSSN